MSAETKSVKGKVLGYLPQDNPPFGAMLSLDSSSS